MGKDERKKMRNLRVTKYHTLTKLSPNFFAELRKGSGEEYEPDSLKVIGLSQIQQETGASFKF